MGDRDDDDEDEDGTIHQRGSVHRAPSSIRRLGDMSGSSSASFAFVAPVNTSFMISIGKTRGQSRNSVFSSPFGQFRLLTRDQDSDNDVPEPDPLPPPPSGVPKAKVEWESQGQINPPLHKSEQIKSLDRQIEELQARKECLQKHEDTAVTSTGVLGQCEHDLDTKGESSQEVKGERSQEVKGERSREVKGERSQGNSSASRSGDAKIHPRLTYCQEQVIENKLTASPKKSGGVKKALVFKKNSYSTAVFNKEHYFKYIFDDPVIGDRRNIQGETADARRGSQRETISAKQVSGRETTASSTVRQGRITSLEENIPGEVTTNRKNTKGEITSQNLDWNWSNYSTQHDDSDSDGMEEVDFKNVLTFTEKAEITLPQRPNIPHTSYMATRSSSQDSRYASIPGNNGVSDTISTSRQHSFPSDSTDPMNKSFPGGYKINQPLQYPHPSSENQVYNINSPSIDTPISHTSSPNKYAKSSLHNIPSNSESQPSVTQLPPKRKTNEMPAPTGVFPSRRSQMDEDDDYGYQDNTPVSQPSYSQNQHYQSGSTGQ